MPNVIQIGDRNVAEITDSTSAIGVEIGKEQAGNIVFRVTGHVDDGDGPQQTVMVALSQAEALHVSQDIKRCVDSKTVHFEWRKR